MSGFVENLFTLKGKVALVTGASSGIGQHLCSVYAKADAHVIAIARRESQLVELVDTITNEGNCAHYLAENLSVDLDYPALAHKISSIAGPPDILINAAGVNLRQHANEVTKKGWSDTLELNLSVPFFLAQALVPGMREKSYGRIINIASLQSYRAFENGIAYGASKGGITQLTRAMAQAWSQHNITANAIAPGFFPTELTKSVFDNEALFNQHATATAIGRNGNMQDLDGISIFLASPASAYITGQIIAADGGYLAK